MLSARSLVVDDLEQDIVFPSSKLIAMTGSDMTSSILDEGESSNVTNFQP